MFGKRLQMGKKTRHVSQLAKLIVSEISKKNSAGNYLMLEERVFKVE